MMFALNYSPDLVIYLKDIGDTDSSKWTPFETYTISFHAKTGCNAFYFLAWSEGAFRIPGARYHLESMNNVTRLELGTSYPIDEIAFLLMKVPIRVVVKIVQRYLFNSIKKNTE